MIQSHLDIKLPRGLSDTYRPVCVIIVISVSTVSKVVTIIKRKHFFFLEMNRAHTPLNPQPREKTNVHEGLRKNMITEMFLR